MEEKRIAAALIDVGDTLWAGHPKHWVDVDGLRVKRLCEGAPGLNRALAGQLRHEVMERAARLEQELELDVLAVIRDVLEELGLPVRERDVEAIRAAIAVPMGSIAELLPGAQELLATVKELDLRCIIVSNTIYRNALEYRRDFEDQGLLRYIDGIVTSFNMGFRKPHLAMFEAAMSLAGCSARQCVFIGDSERNDVLPAVSLGMQVIRVAIEEPPPANSAANALVTSLADATETLRRWVADKG